MHCSDEHPRHTARSLADGKGRWTCPGALFRPAGQPKPQQIEAEFKFQSPTLITGLDIGNFWSASLEVLVGKADWDTGQKEVLLPKIDFMNRNQCFSGENKEKVVLAREDLLRKEVASQKWDSIKLVCSQPHKFNNEVFGISMFVLHGQEDEREVDKENTEVELKVENKGLQELEKKLERAAPPRQQTKLSSTLQSLENSTRVNTEGRELGMRLESAAISRSAKLVAKALGPNSTEALYRKEETAERKVMDPLKEDCLNFLHSCGFDELTFVEIEAVTFRKVKDLWKEKKKQAMTAEEKECLKPLSVKFLSRLLSRTQKRVLEGEKADTPSKRRKVSEKVLEMRRQDSMEEEVVGEGGMRRNQLATRDKVSSMSKGSTETLALERVNVVKQSSHSQQIQSSPQSQTKGSFKTPEFVLDRSIEDEEKETVVKKMVKEKAEEKAIFDLGEVVEIEENSPEEVEVLKVKAGKKRHLGSNTSREQRTPVYQRKRLPDFTQRALVKAGILVQVYNYKKAKELPLRGGKMLKVDAQQTVTFYKVGPDIHLETEGRFHLPEVQPEHRERLFKNFSPRRVNDMSYPAGLEAFFASKDGLKIQSPAPGPSETKVIAREGSDVKETSQEPTGSPGKSGVESKASSSPQRSASPCTSCPLCSRSFPIEELEEHAARCCGAEEEDTTANCPICDLELQVEALEQHAATCAAATFGS